MGLAASQGRLLQLTAYQSDLELTGQFINQARTSLANQMGTLFTISQSLDPSSPATVRLNAQIAAIQSLDKMLELNLRRVDTQRQAVSTEIEAVQKVISKNIQDTYKTFANA